MRSSRGGAQEKGEAGPRTYPACHTADESVIFSISHQDHMMWGKPTSSTSITNWGDWKVNVCDLSVEVSRPTVSRTQRLSVELSNHDAETPSVLNPRSQFGLEVRVGLTQLRVGTGHGIKSKKENSQRYPKIALGGRSVAVGRWAKENCAHSSEPGMAGAASPGRWPGRVDQNADANSLARDLSWGDKTVSVPEDDEYIALCRGIGGFPPEGSRTYRRMGRG